MHRATPLRLAVLICCLLTLIACERRQHLVEQHLLEFGTLIQITLLTNDLEKAERLLEEIESHLKTWRNQWHAWDDSDLTRFNAALATGNPVKIPDSLYELVVLSRDYYQVSDGRFNPALGKLVAAWGFHADQADNHLIAEIGQHLPGMDDLEIDGRIARSRNPHLQLDFGGIAKGYALSLIRDLLDANGIVHYVVNAGGDLITAGNRFGRPWRIGIQNPYAPGAAASIELEGHHSLFTSGNYRRRYLQGDTVVHHIFDPRSGKSATGQSSVTILSKDPIRADVAATAFMIDGLQEYAELARALQIDDYLVIGESGQILVSRSWSKKVRIILPWDTKIVN